MYFVYSLLNSFCQGAVLNRLCSNFHWEYVLKLPLYMIFSWSCLIRGVSKKYYMKYFDTSVVILLAHSCYGKKKGWLFDRPETTPTSFHIEDH